MIASRGIKPDAHLLTHVHTLPQSPSLLSQDETRDKKRRATNPRTGGRPTLELAGNDPRTAGHRYFLTWRVSWRPWSPVSWFLLLSSSSTVCLRVRSPLQSLSLHSSLVTYSLRSSAPCDRFVRATGSQSFSEFSVCPGEARTKKSQRSSDPAIQRSSDPAIQRSSDPAVQRSNDPTFKTHPTSARDLCVSSSLVSCSLVSHSRTES